MNLFYRAAESRNGSQKKILDEFRKRDYFSYCVLVDYSGGVDEYDNDYYTLIPAGICYTVSYEKFCNTSAIPEPEIELLDKMEQYKPTFLHMAGLRPHNMYTEDYFSLDIRYYTALRFWNYILDKYKIDVAFFACIPHWEWEYLVYALCKCKEIPTLLIYGTHIPAVACVGTSIEKMGAGTAAVMKRQIDTFSSPINEYVNDFLNRASGLHSRHSDKEKQKQHDHYYNDRHKRMSYIRILSDLKNKRDLRGAIKSLKQASAARHDAKGLRFYNSISVKELKDEPFVYFALQLVPEATTLPWAGIFQNQLISIRMLAEAGKKYGFKVYVKEHFVQPCRPDAFYKELQKIPGVVLINAYIDSYKLIQNSIANATQTGSVITESVIKGKPVISFVDSFWSGADNVHIVKSKNDLNKIFTDIGGGYGRGISGKQNKIFSVNRSDLHTLETGLCREHCFKR